MMCDEKKELSEKLVKVVKSIKSIEMKEFCIDDVSEGKIKVMINITKK